MPKLPDYYTEKERSRASYAVYSMRAMLILSIIWILAMLLVGCAPKPYALLPEAIPMKQQGDRVLGVFQSLQGSPERYHAQWFYFPGQGLIDPHQYRIRVILERRHP